MEYYIPYLFFWGKDMKKILLVIFAIMITFLLIQFVIPHYMTRDGLCIVGYHGVVSDEEKEIKYKDDIYTLSVSQFERHMKYLYDEGYSTYNMDEVYDYKQGILEVDKKAVVLTFDDGYKNFNDVVKPILEKYQFKGTCFVIGKHLEDNKIRFLKEEDMINDQYVSYYSHSYDLHRKDKETNIKIIEELTLEEIDQDFKKNKVDCTYFAFPYGKSRDDIKPILEKYGVKLAFSYSQYRHMSVKDDCYFLPRYMIVDYMPDLYFHWIVE